MRFPIVEVATKGDHPGHAFYGNQYGSAGGGMRPGSGTTPTGDQHIFAGDRGTLATHARLHDALRQLSRVRAGNRFATIAAHDSLLAARQAAGRELVPGHGAHGAIAAGISAVEGNLRPPSPEAVDFGRGEFGIAHASAAGSRNIDRATDRVNDALARIEGRRDPSGQQIAA